MYPTFIVLLTGHLLGDFILQSDAMVRGKAEGRGLIRHSVVVTLVTWLLLGLWPLRAAWLVLAVFVSHLVIDALKSFFGSERVRTFIVDQTAHLAVLWLIAAAFATTMEQSWWRPVLGPYVQLLAVLSGLILAVKVGSILIEKAMKPVLDQLPARDEVGLANGGRWIGMLERALTFLLVVAGQYGAIGFLFAAKSILRFGEIKEPGQRKEVEYIIIGTFMSFGWALAVSMVTVWTLRGTVTLM